MGRIGLVLMWTPALLLCAAAARYFLSPPPLLRPSSRRSWPGSDPVLLANGGILLWPLNLAVAEWLVRRPAPIRGRAMRTARAPG